MIFFLLIIRMIIQVFCIMKEVLESGIMDVEKTSIILNYYIFFSFRLTSDEWKLRMLNSYSALNNM